MGFRKQIRRILHSHLKKTYSNMMMGFRNSFAVQKKIFYNIDLPRVINISFLEKTCMFSCVMCPYYKPDVKQMYHRPKDKMTIETLRNIIRSIPNDHKYTFDLSNIGETLVFDQLAEFIQVMKTERPLVQTVVSTNALLLDEKTFQGLLKSGLNYLQLSLFAANAKDHEVITGTKTFEKICENIRKASMIKKESGSNTPILRVFMLASKETESKSNDFVTYWSQYVDEAYVRPLYNLGHNLTGLTPLFENKVLSRRYPCITPWYSIAIRSNGDVLGCYMFHWHKESKNQIVGNINSLSLKEIWRSEPMVKLRSAHLSLNFNHYPVCQECNLWDAYPNIWSKKGSSFFYRSFNILDHFKSSKKYRGG